LSAKKENFKTKINMSFCLKRPHNSKCCSIVKKDGFIETAFLAPHDINLIKKNLKLKEKDFIHRRKHHLTKKTIFFIKTRRGGGCIFFNPKENCKI